MRLVPAGLATIRDRSFAGDPDRKLAWLLVAATIPAALAGFFLNDVFEEAVRAPGVVAVTLVIGGIVLWLADRLGATTKRGRATSRSRSPFGIGVAQALALVPGHQPVGHLDLGRPRSPAWTGRRPPASAS